MCREFSAADLDEDLLRTSGYLYFTGSMWDTEVQKGAIQRAISICRQAEITVVFDLADPFAVDRYREGCGEGSLQCGVEWMREKVLQPRGCVGVGGGFPLAPEVAAWGRNALPPPPPDWHGWGVLVGA
jgi:hypothetical protein